MLSLYGSFTVPGVPDVVLYRDDENPRKFYMVSGKPRILRADPRDPTSRPMLDLIAYVRDLSQPRPPNDDVERGQLQMTVGLAISLAEQTRIRDHLRQRLAEEVDRGFRFLGMPVLPGEPELGYAPQFIGGTAVATTFGEELQIAAQGSCPIMSTGVNSASFSYQLTQSGARLLRQTMEEGVLPIQVRYQGLMMIARIPALTIRIRADRQEFLEQARQNAIMRRYVTLGGGIVLRPVWYPPPTLSSFRSSHHSLTVEIDDGDFRDADPSEDLTQELERMAMNILQNNILPGFFERAIPAEDETDAEKDRGYWFRETTTDTGSVDVTISRRDVVQIEHGANAILGAELTPADTAAAIVYANLSQANIPIMRLTVAPNINFQIDPIQSVSVFVDYDQFDDIRGRRIRTQRQLQLSRNGEPQQFAFELAMNTDRTPKLDYRYRTVIHFVGSMVTAEHPPAGGWNTASSEYLVISYAQLGQLKVDLLLAPMPPEVASVDVTLTYPDPAARGAVKTLTLSQAQPTGSWLVSVPAGGPIRPYRVERTYRMTDGTTLSLPADENAAETLTITSPFEARVTTTFVGRGDFANDVQSILVIATYADPAHDLTERITLTLDGTTRTAPWTVRLADKDLLDFAYDVQVLRRNGSENRSSHRGRLGDVITVGPTGADALEIIVDAEMVDWARYARVMVTLDYADPDNGLALRKPMLFSDTGLKLQSWTVLLADPARRGFRYSVRRVGRSPADDLTEPPVDTEDPFVILR
ncbi:MULTISPECIES: hypothetical protein [unclassified Paracoccus (in: a-proteobacteria)]|uniref:hypothetical protein n=1 Tax=unclassified Paracoccus (in: a-proteobacteria) TaxID=2688777 RepID=UPI0012B2AC97|nr:MULTISPECIES: hypothetical protein [unclassified Paracoccus (in: a-proteobacteria)]UXU76514.1 hypothetical protein GB879_014150 [Paracoccus sp. SMMA_5]UXU82419.1 hypothetical protein GB880_014285 [Paracoccus sp. SMMA_5_TC]